MSLPRKLLSALNDGIAKRSLDLVGDAIRKNAAPCYRLISEGADHYQSIGNTRFGGEPDLPKHFDWPTDGSKSGRRNANFIAQINFAEFPRIATEPDLPRRGILYLFVRYMYSAGEPVLVTGLFYDGTRRSLARRASPPNDTLCDQYLVELRPQRVRAVPSISIASYRETFRHKVERTEVIDGDEGEYRLLCLDQDFVPKGSLGQLLGFANAGDIRENLYRQVVLARLGKRDLTYSDYWTSYEDYLRYERERTSGPEYAKQRRRQRPRVKWLTDNKAMISRQVSQWRLLFQIESNPEMNLWMMDADPLYVFIRKADLRRRNFSDLTGEVTQS